MVIKGFFKVFAGFLAAAVASSGAVAAPAAAVVISNNMPGFVTTAQKMGPTDPTQTIDVVIWLKVRNRAALDQLTSELYDPQSPRYRQWITPTDFQRTFAPAAQDAATVASFLPRTGYRSSKRGRKTCT
jgi:subtilase family serine protease